MKFLIALITLLVTCQTKAEPLRIGYSDWPGWVSWEIAIENGWFEEAGLEVEFEWFDYVASMDAFAAGQLDAVGMTNGDTLVTGSSGAKGVMVLLHDYSNGNDMIVAAPGIQSVADLKGKKIGVEIGFVSHLLLLNALEGVGLSEADVELINVPTNETPQVLASRDVDAIVAWQPSSSLALQSLPGATAIYTSADEPGLIYDLLVVSPYSLAQNQPEWRKVVDIWYRIVEYMNNPDTRAEAIEIMAARVGLSAEEYEPFLAGTRILNREEASKYFIDKPGFDSLYGSTRISDAFNVKYQAYKEPQPIERYIDPSLTIPTR
ncbi:MAG: NitT/TauT family transport system substrate-binding protein [Candidatus Azotimanducaceae bacterium]|jgi:NitT/TauT family transport system substrate-binding protein